MGKKIKTLDDLSFDEKNINKGSEYGSSLLAKSLQEVGAGRSALADKNGVLIAGNKTVEKFAEIGLSKIKVVETTGDELVIVQRTDLDINSPQGAKMKILDNTVSKHNYIEDAEVAEAVCEEFELEAVELGLAVPAKEHEAVEDDFDATPPAEPITVLGDLYEIGEHRLLCGDSTDSDAVARLMNGEKADMVFTDPPYGYSYESNHQRKHKELLNDDKILNFLPNVFLFSKDDIAIYLFCGWQTLKDWIIEVENNSFDLKNIIIWKKNNWSMGDLKGAYAGQYEIMLFLHKGRIELKNGRGQDVWEFDRVPPKEHPTMKPVELIEKALKDTTITNDLVLDLFLGSGSTMVAAHQLNRKCYGMELEPKYCDVIVKRMLKLDPTLTIKRNGVDCKKDFQDA